MHRSYLHLMEDSLLGTGAEAKAIAHELISLDAEIFSTYDATVSRINEHQVESASRQRLLVFIVLLSCLLTLGSMLALHLANANSRDERGVGLFGFYTRFFNELTTAVSPTTLDSPSLAKVNPIVVVGAICMAISVISYLLSRLI